MKRLLSIAALCLLAGAVRAEERYTAAQLQADVGALRAALHTHPDLSFSVDPAALDARLDALRAQSREPLTATEAWRALATVNPLLADAHLFVGLPDWRGATAAHLRGGGALFPYEVALDDGKLRIVALLGGGATDLAGAQIEAIDGRPAAALAGELLSRTHGDTPAFRTHLLGQRWWLYHWRMRGAPASYRIDYAQGARRWSADVAGSGATPAALREGFDDLYGLRFLPDGRALLTLGSFSTPDSARFLAFTRAAFERLRAAGTTTLLIDVRANGGGDDALWLDGVLPYLATRPYRTGSTFRKRVLNPGPGETAGQVTDGAIATWHAPRDEPLRFAGTVCVLVGPATYSSAILFANVLHDFGFATLAGTGGAARRTQSGGVRAVTLPNTGLPVYVPRFILDPPAGGPRTALLQPAPPPPACAAP